MQTRLRAYQHDHVEEVECKLPGHLRSVWAKFFGTCLQQGSLWGVTGSRLRISQAGISLCSIARGAYRTLDSMFASCGYVCCGTESLVFRLSYDQDR